MDLPILPDTADLQATAQAASSAIHMPQGAPSSPLTSLSNIPYPPSSNGTEALNNPSAAPTAAAGTSNPDAFTYSSTTAEVLARINAQRATGYDSAREHILNSIVTSDKLPHLPPTKNGRGRGRPKGSSKAAGEAGLVPKRTGRKPGRGRARGGARMGKRKREESEEELVLSSDGDEVDVGEDDDVTLPRVTKSGRAVNRPTQFVPVLPSPSTSAKKKKRIRRNPESAVCKACERGHSPNNNAIVFCDGCATPYHQYCHDPPIEKEFVEIPDKEWLCIECATSRAERPLQMMDLVSGSAMTDEEKRVALTSLKHEQLVEILMHVHSNHPTIAIFPPANSSLISTMNGIEHLTVEQPNEQPYDGYETDPPAHYPKPGNGLARTLPPESEDLPWLIDDNFDVFNHVTNYSSVDLNAVVGSQPTGLTAAGAAR